MGFFRFLKNVFLAVLIVLAILAIGFVLRAGAVIVGLFLVPTLLVVGIYYLMKDHAKTG